MDLMTSIRPFSLYAPGRRRSPSQSSGRVGLLLCVLASAFAPLDLRGQAPSAIDVDSLRIAAEGGDPEAQYAYGQMYEVGAGDLSVDYQVALEWYERAAEQDHLPALLSLSTMLLGSEPQRAMELVLEAAELGSPEAQWRAGQVYAGRIYLPLAGVNLDRETAVRWFTRAAEQEHHPSEEALADLLTESDDPAEHAQSVELYRRAAEEGDSAWAVLRMGMMYATGEGVEEDDEAARTWLSRLGSGYDLNPDLFANEDLEVLGGLQWYYGLSFVGGEAEADRAAAQEAFTIALESVQGMMFRPFVHPSFARTAQRMLEKLRN